MSLTASWALLRAPALRARIRFRNDLRRFVRLHFLASGLETGIFEALRDPLQPDELAERLGFLERETLATLLDLGVALGELRITSAGYHVSGSTARALIARNGDALRAVVLELVDYHSLAYRELPQRLRTGSKGDYLADRAPLIQRSSRIVEPALGAFVRGLVRGTRRLRILELGCGSGIYLRHACEANPQVQGVGVEKDARVVAAARENTRRWGIDERIRIVQADARQLPEKVGEGFDLITLYNNIYYFDRDERVRLLADLRSRLATNGQIAIVTMLRVRTPAALGLDLVLASTRGCTHLPTEYELETMLRMSEYKEISRRTLVPGEPLIAWLCSAAAPVV